MNESNKQHRTPDFSSDGCAVWVNQTKEGKPYLSIKMVGHSVVNAFKNEPKPVVQTSPMDVFNQEMSQKGGYAQ